MVRQDVVDASLDGVIARIPELDDLVASGGAQPGSLVMFVASGGGLSFATALARM